MAQPYIRAFGIGFVSGMRSMTGPAATRIRGGGTSAVLVPLMAVGEIIVDKMPGIPARTSPLPLAFRAISGGVAGRHIARDRGGNGPVAFALGALGAVAAAYLAVRLRAEARRRTGLPDPLIALAEDALAVSAGYLLTA